jgi:hypothetical protein
MADFTEAHPLVAEAVERLSGYELVQSLTFQAGETDNSLGVDPIPVEGGVIYPIGSGLVTETPRARERRLAVIGDRLARITTAGSFMAYADFVGLWPHANNGAGEAALYGVTAPLNTEEETEDLPFQTAVSSMIGEERGAFVGHQFFHFQPVDTEPDNPERVFATGSGVLLDPTSGTSLVVERVGVNELDKVTGMRVSFSGPAVGTLDARQLLSVARSQVYATPKQQTPVDLVLPHGYPQEMGDRYAKVPFGSNVVIKTDEQGGRRVAIDQGDRNEESHMRYRSLHPRVVAAGVLAHATRVPWEDITDDFLTSNGAKLHALFGDPSANAYQALLGSAREAIVARIREGLPYRDVGCLAIAARLGSEFSVRPYRSHDVTELSFA